MDGKRTNDDRRACPRGHWRPAEDEKLRQLVEKYGPQNWNSIAEKFQERSGKSCRLRWFNQLDPRINRRPFTEEEESLLLAAHKIHGSKWALISRLFPGRTDNAVKNHWHVIMARKQRSHQKSKNINHDSRTNSYSFRRNNNVIRKIEDDQEYGASRIIFENNRVFQLQNQKKDALFSISSSTASTSSDTFSIFAAYRGLNQGFMSSTHQFMHYGEEKRDLMKDFGSDYHQQVDDENKSDVPFIDFLGVGISSS